MLSVLILTRIVNSFCPPLSRSPSSFPFFMWSSFDRWLLTGSAPWVQASVLQRYQVGSANSLLLLFEFRKVWFHLFCSVRVIPTWMIPAVSIGSQFSLLGLLPAAYFACCFLTGKQSVCWHFAMLLVFTFEYLLTLDYPTSHLSLHTSAGWRRGKEYYDFQGRNGLLLVYISFFIWIDFMS